MPETDAVRIVEAVIDRHWNDDGECACGYRSDGGTQRHVAEQILAAMFPSLDGLPDPTPGCGCDTCLLVRGILRVLSG